MEAPGRAPQRILCAPTPRSWQVDVSHQRCSPSEQLHVIAAQRSVGLSSPHSTHPHAGWATIGGRPGAWGHGRARCRPSRQSALTSEQPSTLPSLSCRLDRGDGPGIESHGPARLIQDRQSPHLPDNRWHCPSPPSRIGRKVQPTGPAGWYKIRLLPILQPTGPVRRVRAAASAEAV